MNKTGLFRREIENMIEEKIKELKGLLLSENGAIVIIAKELGVDLHARG